MRYSGSELNMIALIQRVTQASVSVDDQIVGQIGPGLLALVAVEPGDAEPQLQRMAQRLLGYRVFSDAEGKMNLSLSDTGGGLLLVSQFTLAADTNKGMRPSFTSAAKPEMARQMFDRLVSVCAERHQVVATGKFGEHMEVKLMNDGPVTFLLTCRDQSPPPKS